MERKKQRCVLSILVRSQTNLCTGPCSSRTKQYLSHGQSVSQLGNLFGHACVRESQPLGGNEGEAKARRDDGRDELAAVVELLQ